MTKHRFLAAVLAGVMGWIAMVEPAWGQGPGSPRPQPQGYVLTEFMAGVVGGLLVNTPAMAQYVRGITGEDCPQDDARCREIARLGGITTLLLSHLALMPLGVAAGVTVAGMLSQVNGNLVLTLFGAYAGSGAGIVLASFLIGLGANLSQYLPSILPLLPPPIAEQVGPFFGIVSDLLILFVPPVVSALLSTVGFNTGLAGEGAALRPAPSRSQDTARLGGFILVFSWSF